MYRILAIAGSPLLPCLLSNSFYHIDQPASSYLQMRPAHIPSKVSRTRVGKANKTKLQTSSGHIIPSIFLPFILPKLQTRFSEHNKSQQVWCRGCIQWKYIHLEQRTSQRFHLIQKPSMDRFILINYSLLCKSSRQHDTCVTLVLSML